MALHSIASNSWTETGVRPRRQEGTYCDAGDLKFTFQEPFPAIETEIGELLDKGLRPVSLGGDHFITLPIVRAFGKHVPGLTILHVDAHPDLYDELEGNRLSHACPFARIMEEGATEKRLIQIGIKDDDRASTRASQEIRRRSGRDAALARARPHEVRWPHLHLVGILTDFGYRLLDDLLQANRGIACLGTTDSRKREQVVDQGAHPICRFQDQR